MKTPFAPRVYHWISVDAILASSNIFRFLKAPVSLVSAVSSSCSSALTQVAGPICTSKCSKRMQGGQGGQGGQENGESEGMGIE